MQASSRSTHLGWSLLALSVMAWCTPAYAIEPGLKFGLSSAHQTTEEGVSELPSTLKRVKKPTIGVLIHVPMKGWGVTSSLNYVQKGRTEAATFADNSEGYYRDVTVRDALTYLSLQVDLRVNMQIGSASFYVLAGPKVDYLLTNERSKYAQYGWPSALHAIAVPEYNKWVGGASIGLGQDITVGRHTIFLEVRYDHDITPAWELPGQPGTRTFSQVEYPAGVYNETFLFQLGLKLWTSKARPKKERLPQDHWLPVNAPPPR